MSALESLADLAENLESMIKTARKAGNISALLALTHHALDQLEQAANTQSVTESERQHALNVARRLSYNAAADAWPAWDFPPPPRTHEDLLSAHRLATRCAHTVEQLPTNLKHKGNAAWLIGAFDLALKNQPSAITQFQTALTHFATIPDLKLMTEGYLAIAGAPTAPSLLSTIEALTTSSIPHATALAEQLQTAQKALNESTP